MGKVQSRKRGRLKEPGGSIFGHFGVKGHRGLCWNRLWNKQLRRVAGANKRLDDSRGKILGGVAFGRGGKRGEPLRIPGLGFNDKVNKRKKVL